MAKRTKAEKEEKKLDPVELAEKLAEAEQIIEALRNEEVDAIVSHKRVLMLRLHGIEDMLKSQRDQLETLDQERNNLVESLKINQVELETQAEELRESQQAAQESLDKYRDLYDYAPVGYLSLDKEARVLEANLTAARLLGLARNRLIHSPFTKVIAPDSQDTFYFHLKQTFRTGAKQVCEVRMFRKGGSPFFAQVESITATHSGENPDHLHTTLTDITGRKQAEEALARAKDELEIKVKERTQELLKANEQLNIYSHRITQVQEEEKKRIAFELHDDTAQYLSILKMQLGALLNSGKVRDPEVKQRIQFLEKDADRAFNDVRRYSHELRPAILDNLGLQAAFEQMEQDTNNLKQIKVELQVEGEEPKLSDEMKLALFRIAQEALNNARKHAGASVATMALRYTDSRMIMCISDNGRGFDVQEASDRAKGKGSLGLSSMQERANLIGADLKIESKPGEGTRVTAEVRL